MRSASATDKHRQAVQIFLSEQELDIALSLIKRYSTTLVDRRQRAMPEYLAEAQSSAALPSEVPAASTGDAQPAASTSAPAQAPAARTGVMFNELPQDLSDLLPQEPGVLPFTPLNGARHFVSPSIDAGGAYDPRAGTDAESASLAVNSQSQVDELADASQPSAPLTQSLTDEDSFDNAVVVPGTRRSTAVLPAASPPSAASGSSESGKVKSDEEVLLERRQTAATLAGIPDAGTRREPGAPAEEARQPLRASPLRGT